MIKQLFQNLFGVNGVTKSAWTPVEHTFVKDDKIRKTLHEDGWFIAGRLDADTINGLRKLYADHHRFNMPAGGMFYSVYSRDLGYRRTIHDQIGAIMKTTYGGLFEDYKTVINSFIVKVNGPESEFTLHQDSTGLDEMKYSCLSVWIPLQDTTTENGCLCVVPKSHHMFSPYRGISFPQPFESIQDEVKKYLVPIEMKAGEILLFDNRLVHNSLVNDTETERVVVMSGIFPREATIISCYKDAADKKGKIELIRQDDDYLLTFENFFHDCICRPETGHSLCFVDWDTSQMKKEEFVALCNRYGVREVNHPSLRKSSTNPSIIGEPKMASQS